MDDEGSANLSMPTDWAGNRADHTAEARTWAASACQWDTGYIAGAMRDAGEIVDDGGGYTSCIGDSVGASAG